MHLLALDTSTHQAALAIAAPGGAVVVAEVDPSQRHGRGLIPALRDLLRTAGLTVADLEAVAVGLGPGSFTGLRVGVTAAKTLAFATGCPLVGLDSLEVIAQNAPLDALRVSVVVDAQRGDLFAADFARQGPAAPLVRVTPTRVEPAASWAARLPQGTLVLGSATGLPLPPTARLAPPGLGQPEGSRLIALARESFAAGLRQDPWFLEPLYLRRSAAEDQWDNRTIPAGGGNPS